MKERPILFSAPMVKALLAGTKTQTRRVVKQQGSILTDDLARSLGVRPPIKENSPVIACPYGQPGDRIWVKETWSAGYGWDEKKPTDIPDGAAIKYNADGSTGGPAAQWIAGANVTFGRLRPSLFMRRWMSRLTLEIVSVRVERLHAITEADAIAEGVKIHSDAAVAAQIAKQYDNGIPEDRQLNEAWSPATMEYWALWEKLNGIGSWGLNPWVWVVEFRRVEQ